MKLSAPPDLPRGMRARFDAVRGRLAESSIALPGELAASAARVGIVSNFAIAVLMRFPEELGRRLQDGSPLSAEAVAARLELGGLSEPAAMRALRRFRQVELARIAWRDLAGWCGLETGFAELSALADGVIQSALGYAGARVRESGRETPRDSEPAPLLVLGMGKLGGEELNYSSDVDLVFLHPAADSTDAGDAAPEAYYRRVAQLLIKLLDQATEDGFAFRVDTRLRPFGASGPLVVSIPAFESYLVRHGRDWERYAYVKARLITGRKHAREVFDEILTPFVYRRYLDFGVFEALRQMKRLISRETARQDMAENIKLGPGGIREIEFIVQAFQLVRGGGDPALRERSLLRALGRLGGERDLGQDAVAALSSAYRCLRTLENRLQAMDDRQTHDLPAEAETRERLAYAFGEPGWTRLHERLNEHRAAVEAEFARIAWDGGEGNGRGAVAAAWEEGTIGDALAGTRLAQDDDAERLLTELRRGGLYLRMDEIARQRLAAVVARAVPLIAEHASPAVTLARFVPILRAICRRSAYLALLNENPDALDRLLDISSRSALPARQIAEHPLLLDELLDARVLETPPTREELAELLRRHERAADADDTESLLEAIQHFQRAALFRIAIADRFGSLPLMKVSDRLTDTAELVLECALRTAWSELVSKYGTPVCGDPPNLRKAGFAVIGYGKLGGLETGYGSDLDLVFLHDSSGAHRETDGTPPLDNERFFARLAQRLIHFLTVQTSTGRLYEVDTRLRPSGRAGLLVSSLDSFRRYQRNDAWIWEHQALLRSRSVEGSSEAREAFESERREVLIHHVDRARLKQEVASMRSRMRSELSLGKPQRFDIKQDPGGLVDIEFLVDYWVLANADRFPELVEFPDNVRQLDALQREGLVSGNRTDCLRHAYLELRRRLHELALDEGGRVVDDGELREPRAAVVSVWSEVFG